MSNEPEGIPLASLLGPDRRTPEERLNQEVVASLRREVDELEAEVARLKAED
jgi:hypothetical protein